MNWLGKKKSVLGFGVALCVLVAISIESYINLRQFKKANRWVEHTQLVKNQLDDLLLQLTETETAQRGYILTGESSYLKDYQTAINKAVKPEIQAIRQLTRDNPIQQRRLNELEPLVSAQLAVLEQTLDLQRNQGFDVALQAIRTGKGKLLMDEIRQLIGEMGDTENELFLQRSATSEAQAQTTTLVIVLGSLLAALIVALAIFTLDQDINKRMRVEEQLQTLNSELEQRVSQRTQQLEAASRAKDEFLSILSHELRTPLNAVLGWSRLLRGGQLSEAKTAQAIEIIERNAKSQSQLIDDLLDISRVIQGKLRLNVRPVQPFTLIEAAINTVRPAADARSIRLQAVLDPSAGPISGDSERLQQVVWNLLSNAIKFTPKGGRVQIRLERINSHIEITVSDTGIGIGPNFLPYVFERFRQSDSTSTRTYGGLGLGLAIVRQLVELHGGTVHAASPGEGQGATFTVILPLMILHKDVMTPVRVHPQVEGEVPLNPNSSLDGLQVLVVDDEADACELLTTVLEECGARVIAVASVPEALSVLKQLKPDVLVSDIGMPDEDGYALMRTLRGLAAERGGQIPAMALTAYARSEDRIRALQAGFQMHMPKPLEPAELIAAVANLAGRTGQV